MHRIASSPGWSLFVLLGAASCATVGRQFDVNAVRQLEVGKTTMAEARQLLGNPLAEINTATWGYQRMHFGDESTATIWRYMHGSGSVFSTSSRFAQVEFDKDGRVTDYYYSTGGDSVEKDFDIFAVRDRVVPGKATRAEVLALLGDGYRSVQIKKPGTHERWRYGFTSKSKDEETTMGTSVGAVTIKKIYGKSVEIDFDADGTVTAVRGESDFPADKDRAFTK